MNKVGEIHCEWLSVMEICMCSTSEKEKKRKSNVNSNLYDKYWEIIINYNHAIMVCSKVF